MTPLNFNDVIKDGLEVVLVNEKPYMFTNLRVDRKTIPQGFIAYDVRDDDYSSGVFANIKHIVIVNHWGTIIGETALPLEDGIYWCTDEDGSFIGETVHSVKDFEEVKYA